MEMKSTKELEIIDNLENKDVQIHKLTEKQKKFIYYYTNEQEEQDGIKTYGNATKSYSKAYGTADTVSGVSGHHLLKNPKIKEVLDVVLNANGFNDFVIDNQLLKICKDEDPKNSIQGIKEYNKLKGRIVSKSANLSQNLDLNIEANAENVDDLLKNLLNN